MAAPSRLLRVAPDRRLAVTLEDGDAPVVLMAHGVGSSAMFTREAFAEPLHRAGWRLASVDLRGHGDSDPARRPQDHLLDTHARDLTMVAEAVGADVVGGISLGAMAAVRAATSGLSVRALVAVIPGWTGRSVVGEGPHAAIAAEVRRDGVAGILVRLESELDLPAWIREVVLRDYRRHDTESLAAALTALDGGEGPSLDEVANLQVPLGVVAWPGDPGHPLEVAQSWVRAAARSSLELTTIAALEDDRTAFGSLTVVALETLGVRPSRVTW